MMWKVEVDVYYRSAGDSILTREYFNSKKAALEYVDSLGEDLNADITLEDMTPIGDGEYTDGEVTWIREAIKY